MIWDLQVHLSGVDGKTPEERMEQPIKIADRMGIERLCVCMGMPWGRDPGPDDLRRENDQVLQAIGKFPDRTFGFVYLNPRQDEASLVRRVSCAANGPMVGAKLWAVQREAISRARNEKGRLEQSALTAGGCG